MKTFGSVNTFSAYNFENHIYKISQLVRGKRLVIQQICNKLAAWHRLSLKFQLDQNRVHAHSFRNNDRDCYIELSQGRLGKIVAIESDKYCVRLFKSVNNLFNYPLPKWIFT